MDPRMRRFAELGVATVYEAADRAGLINLPLIQLIAGSRVAGPALTVACGQGDNLAVHIAVERVLPGHVVVLAMPQPEPVGLIGELLVTQIRRRGAAAILSNGAVRDSEQLRGMGLPIWSQYVRAVGATKSVSGSVGELVTIGGVSIATDDLIVLDADGATSVASRDFERVLARSEERVTREAELRRRFEAGEISLDTHGLRDVARHKG